MLPIAVYQSAYLQLTHRHRGQASSHIDSVISQGATWLEQQPQVARVCYPGLKSHPQHDLAKQQMRGFGGMISVGLNSDLARARRFLENVSTCGCG